MSNWTPGFQDGLTFAECTQYGVDAFALCCDILILLCVYVPGIMLEIMILLFFEIFSSPGSLTSVVCQILQRLRTIVVVKGRSCFYVQLCKLGLLTVNLPPYGVHSFIYLLNILLSLRHLAHLYAFHQ